MNGLAQDIDIVPAAGGSARLRGHLVRPEGAGPWPGVVVIHEAFGLDAQTRRHTQRLAAAGYLALAVDLYSQGGAVRCTVATMRALGAGRGRPFADIGAARALLAAHRDCTRQVGVIGFCLGGGFALLTAGAFAASSVNYGRVPADAYDALRGACPVVASYGGRDRSLAGTADRLEAALARLGIPHDVREYPEAGHSFLNDAPAGPRPLRPLLRVAGIGPQPEAAADAWRRIEAFFSEHLAGPPAPR